MAKKVTITLEDDLVGGVADETVSFGLDGKNYSIDLNEKNADKLRESLAKYIAVADKVPATGRRGRRAAAVSGDGPSAKEIREWGRAQGMKVPERGRIPADVREAYESAH